MTVLLERSPIFSSGLPMWTPGVSASSTKALMPFLPFSGWLMAMQTKYFPTPPLVIQALEPLSRQPPSTLVARVFSAAASEPASGSVSMKPPSTSPLARGFR